MTPPLFPNGASRLRVARPTDQLDAAARFCRKGMGLPVIGHFEDHDGHDGVLLGRPDAGGHLELTHRRAGSPGAAPSRDNRLVVYAQDRSDLNPFEASFAATGCRPVEPGNPDWLGKSLTSQAPDSWRAGVFGLSVMA